MGSKKKTEKKEVENKERSIESREKGQGIEKNGKRK